LEKIKEKISKPSFDTWLKNTKAKSLVDDRLVVTAPNAFARDWLEGRYTNLINEILEDITGAKLSTEFITPESQENLDDINPAPKKVSNFNKNDGIDSPKTMLNSKYTFDTFVIGSGNRFAHAASLAVAEA